MAYISYIKLWESEFDGIVSKRDNLQDLNINQLKLEVHDTYKKDEKLTTNFEPDDNEDVINKGYLDEKLLKIDGHLSKLEKDYNEFKLQYNKQSVDALTSSMLYPLSHRRQNWKRESRINIHILLCCHILFK